MLSRLALRLAAVNALRGHTIAGLQNVFDSRQDAIDTMDTSSPVPVLAVYTETDASIPYGTGRIKPADIHVHLVIECIQVVKGTATITGPDGTPQDITELGTPITDQVQEALVDLLSAQVLRRLTGPDTDAAAALFRAVAMEMPDVSTMPERLPDNGARLAARTIRMKIKIRHDEWPSPGSAPATGFDALPDPLRTVAFGLTDATDLALVAMIASQIAPPSALPPAGEGFNLYANLEPGAVTIPAPNDGQGDPVTGSTDLTASITYPSP